MVVTENYSCLLGTFRLRRTLSLSLIQTYVPTSFIVVRAPTLLPLPPPMGLAWR